MKAIVRPMAIIDLRVIAGTLLELLQLGGTT